MAVKKQVIIDVEIVGEDAVNKLNANLKQTQTDASGAESAIDDLNTSLKQTENTNADETIDRLNDSLEKTETDAKNADAALDSMDGTTKKATVSSRGLTDSVISNGGAMAILDKLTGGYASVLRDALEASELFSTTTKASTTVIAAETTARGANTTVTTAATAASGANTAAGVTATATNTAESASLVTLAAKRAAATAATEAHAAATATATATSKGYGDIVNLATDALKRMAAGTALTKVQTELLTNAGRQSKTGLKETAELIIQVSKKQVDAAKQGAAATGEAVKATTALVKGHKSVGIAAKLAGLATRQALIATGIGAFIVALGLVVAYWEEIVEFITGANAELEKNLALNEQILANVEAQNVQRAAGLTDIDRALAIATEKAKQRGASQKELDELEIKALEDKVELALRLETIAIQTRVRLTNDTTTAEQAEAAIKGEADATKALEEAEFNLELARLKRRGVDVAERRDPIVPIPKVELAPLEPIESGLRKELEEDFTEFLAGQSKKRTELTKEELEIIKNLRLDNQLLILDAAASTFASLAEMSDENSDTQKAFAITSVLIDTAAAIVGTWRGYAQFGPWGTAAAIAQTTAIAAAGAAAIHNITSAGPGGSIDAPDGGGTTPAPPTAQSQQTLTNSINDQNQVPIRAYLVSSDIETQLALDRQISNNSSLGNT